MKSLHLKKKQLRWVVTHYVIKCQIHIDFNVFQLAPKDLKITATMEGHAHGPIMNLPVNVHQIKRGKDVSGP